MEELFGLDMRLLMFIMLVAFLGIVVAVGFTALLNRIMFKIGVRNIPRRPAQTVLIIIGLMLSTLIISAALGTGDTLSFSIRNEVVTGLGEIDELLTSGRRLFLSDDVRSDPYFPASQFEELRASIGGDDRIDGLAPMIAETAPVVNPVARQSAGSMRIAAIDPAEIGIFGPILDVSGSPVRLEELEGNEVVINEAAAKELEAGPGDTLRLFVQGDTVELVVRDVVRKGGLAGDDETTLLSLSRAQEIFGKPDQINSILVSNKGDSIEGAKLSDEVTEFLRELLTNREIAEQIIGALNDAAIISEIRSRAEDQPNILKLDLLEAADLLEIGETTSELISLLADEGTAAQLMLAVEAQKDEIATFQVIGLFSVLNRLNVRDIKADLLDIANLTSSAITSIFVIFGSFSIIAGIMLIFLIFVMLAAERKPEMGIARAIGMRRSHLVQSFVFEGLTYDLLSALVGATLGIMLGMLMVTVMANIFSDAGEDFTLIRHYTLTSFIISYCAGVVLTFMTVLISSYRSSRLNIVSAIRDLPEVFAPSQREPWLRLLGKSLAKPFIFLVRAAKDLRNWRIRRFVLNLVLAALWAIPPIWIGGILWTLARISSPALSRGWLTVILGVLFVYLGIVVNQAAPYTIGVTISIVGLGLMLLWLFRRREWPASRQNRFTAGVIGAVCLFWLGVGIGQGQTFTIVLAILVASFELIRQIVMSRERAVTEPEERNAFTFIGLSMILFWGTPFDALDFIVSDLDSNIEMFIISGVSMVTAAVWVVVYNADLMTNGITTVFGRFSRLRPAIKMAVAYALSSKLRTGLTLAMLSLVIFTLMVMSTLTSSFSAALEDIDSVTGGWDITAVVSFNNPVDDFEAKLTESLGDQANDIEAVGGYTTIPVEARQVGAETQEWKGYRVQGADESFLEYNAHDIQIYSKEFGETKEEIWAALRENPNLAVIDALAAPTRTGGGQFNIGGPRFKMEGFFLEDDDMPATEVEIRDLRSGEIAKVTIIGVLEILADRFGVIITSKSVLDEISDEPVPFTVYRLKVGPEADAADIARNVESSFLENGLESFVLADEIAESREANVAINRLFQGFMATGLLVGIAALGVISFRAVVERRQQIGVLKALGYRRSMILTSYLMESSFIALLGISLGVGLGTLLSINLVDSIGEQVPGLKFTLPWGELAVIVTAAYVFSLLTTFVPARQASSVYPAEALRYE